MKLQPTAGPKAPHTARASVWSLFSTTAPTTAPQTSAARTMRRSLPEPSTRDPIMRGPRPGPPSHGAGHRVAGHGVRRGDAGDRVPTGDQPHSEDEQQRRGPPAN